nr:Chain C, M1-G4E, GILEFVFTL [synthetic construct]5HHP_C Chain C, M1-G4E, GILEFVFTL [synthetic construct]
GILEFVFTL